MAQLKIYGSHRSRANRAVWCARELGVPFEQIEVPASELKSASYLTINPNGKVPAIVDGDVKLFESLAITLYLAKRYGAGKLYPANPADEARVFQWTLWAATEVEPDVVPILYHRVLHRDDATAEAADAAEARLRKTLKVLDDALKGREWLIGNDFSIADLNVAGVLAATVMGKMNYSSLPNAKPWLDRCLGRRDRALNG
jgi:glutathione S-transferase